MKKPNSPAKIPKPVKSVKNGTKAVDMPQINIQKAYKAFRFIHDLSPSHPRVIKIINRDNNRSSTGCFSLLGYTPQWNQYGANC